MLIAKGCPRCAGDVTRVEDVGETYYSCLQCGHIEYRRPEPAAAGHRDDAAERPRPVPVDRAQVRRRQLRRERRRHAVAAR
jgi:hypothetical protein